jgi:hypothetical protein
VVRDPAGLSARRQARIARIARALTRHTLPGYGAIQAALPATNALGTPPFSREHSTTMILYLFFGLRTHAAQQEAVARRLVARVLRPPPGTTAAVTGLAPAQAQTADTILAHLP